MTAGAAAALLVLAAGCGGARAPILEQPVGETHTTSSSTGGARPQGVDVPNAPIGVVVGEEVQHACNLTNAPRDTPRFDVDSARLRPRGEDILARVAACVASKKLGPATTLNIVGYTDPRGSSEYNKQLGLYRAIAAKQRLVDLGVPGSIIAIESQGERDAKGTDEASWALDRRVEIHLLGK